MRKLILGTAMAVLLTGSVAFAAELSATITQIDVSGRIFFIDGKAYHVPASIDIGAFKVGQHVTVTYEIVDGQLTVVSIRIT